MNAKVPLAEVTKKTIVLQVFDWDKITKTDGIGEVQILLVMTSTASIMVNHQPGPDPFVAAQPRHRDQRVEATAQGHRHQWQGGLPNFLRILLKQNTALLSTVCPSVRPCVTGVTSHIYIKAYAMLIIRGPIKPYICILN